MRLDVTIRKKEEIETVADFLSASVVRSINVTHTHDDDIDPLEVAVRLKGRIPDLDIMLHLATKYFCAQSMDDCRMGFQKQVKGAIRAGIQKVLVVSGHPKIHFDSLEALQFLQQEHLATNLEVYCAYNPYFDPARLRVEHERLERKLTFPFLKGICLQIGMDTSKLKKGVDQVRALRPDIALFGSVPVPSEATLNRLKLATLYGVFLPNSYLLSVESAKEMTKDLLAAFKQYRIEPLVFAPHIT
ncbi:hypothetical protein GF380_03830, partial [Candidatus Uhrbacteria bacterium]|nr:hypothetical protein [Candidatus Uhrbacteria bacterium]MBD3284223.1 hypothetical protein [Candidatus Uhrbacteria bacterium]